MDSGPPFPLIEFHLTVGTWDVVELGYVDTGFEGAVIIPDGAGREIAAAPNQWSPHLYGTRTFHLHKFPYLVVSLNSGTVVNVLAVAHGSRRPGYWRRRLP